MRIAKKIIAALLCFVIAAANGLTAFAAPSSWAQEQVTAAIEENLVPQNLRSNYTQPMTRAEFSALAVALYEIVNGEITGRITFTDTEDVNVEKAAYIGIVSGVGDNRFNPDETLTREQAAVMLSRLSDVISSIPFPPFPRQPVNFADNDSISPWAAESVGRVLAAGIMSGVGDNRFAPNQPYTREQGIVTILKTLEWVRMQDRERTYDENPVLSEGTPLAPPGWTLPPD